MFVWLARVFMYRWWDSHINESNNLFKSFMSMSNIHVYTNRLILVQHSFIYSHTTTKYLLYTGQCTRCYVYSEEKDRVPKELMLEKISGLIVEFLIVESYMLQWKLLWESKSGSNQITWLRLKETPEEITEALTKKPNTICRKRKRRVPCYFID